jgi:hypothetical protein
MRWLLTVLLAIAQQAPYPPAYPRNGATKLLENDRIIVWNIIWLKQQYPIHQHPYDLAGVYYMPGDRMIVSVDGSKRPVSTKAGDIAFQRKGVTHIEEGTSDAPLHAVFFEMKEPAPSGMRDTAPSPAAFPAGAAKQLLDNERVTAWEYTPPISSAPHRHQYDALVVGIEGETPHVAYVKRGTVHAQESVGRADRVWVFEVK